MKLEILENDLIRTKDAARILGLAPGSLNNMRQRGSGPPFVRIGASVRYARRDLAAFIDQHRVEPVR
jgi:hypothetical protein